MPIKDKVERAKWQKEYYRNNIDKYIKRNKELKDSGYLREMDWEKMGINITYNEYLELYDKQSGECKICKKHLNISGSQKDKSLTAHVDHDHVTGKIRGLLCHDCNLTLSNSKDNSFILRSGAEYIDNNRSK